MEKALLLVDLIKGFGQEGYDKNMYCKNVEGLKKNLQQLVERQCCFIAAAYLYLWNKRSVFLFLNQLVNSPQSRHSSLILAQEGHMAGTRQCL